MSTSYYVYKSTGITRKTKEQALEEKIMIGVASGGPKGTINFTWSINPFEFMSKYYNEFYFVIDEYRHEQDVRNLVYKLQDCVKVTYDKNNIPE
jgi:hypothetical protein